MSVDIIKQEACLCVGKMLHRLRFGECADGLKVRCRCSCALLPFVEAKHTPYVD